MPDHHDDRDDSADADGRADAGAGRDDGRTGSDPRVDAGIEHLQTAAKELIGAARAFLDVLDDLVDDRDALHDVAAAVTSLADSAVAGARQAGFDPTDLFRTRPRPSGERATRASEPRVEHIRVS